MPDRLPFRLSDYLELLDWTGRIIREDKRGAIPASTQPIVERLGIDPKQWLYSATQFESRFRGLVGSAHNLKRAYQRTPELNSCSLLLP